MRIGSAHPSNPRIISVGRTNLSSETDIRSYDKALDPFVDVALGRLHVDETVLHVADGYTGLELALGLIAAEQRAGMSGHERHDRFRTPGPSELILRQRLQHQDKARPFKE